MNKEVIITFHNLDHSAALDARIREKAAKLHALCADITSLRVLVERVSERHSRGNEYAVHIDVHTPAGRIDVSRIHREDVYVALRDCFDAARRKLLAVLAKRSDAEKSAGAPRGEP